MSRRILPVRTNLYLPIAIGAAIIIRVIYWFSVAKEPWFQTPGMDPEFYRTWATAIIGGHGADYIPFPRAPLYPYLLAGIIKYFGSWWLVPRLFNLVCDLTSVWAIWTLAKRIAGVRAGFIAALLFGLCGMAIYQSGELLMTSLETALAALFLLSLITAIESRSIRGATLTGFIVAMFTLCRPSGLLLVLFMPLAMIYLSGKGSRSSLLPASCALLSALVCLTPVTYFNYMATGKIVPVATQGGVNFFIGNAQGATGWASSLPGVGADWTDADATRLAELDAGISLNPYEQSQQLFKMGIDQIKSAPSAWLGLMIRKTLIMHNIHEIGNNRPLNLPKEAAPFLHLLFLLSLGGLLPFAIVGLIQSRSNFIIIKVSIGFIIIFGGSLLFFFISGRYRMPLLPVCIVFAGIGIAYLSNKWSNVLRLSSLIAILTGFIIALPPWAGSNFDNAAQGYFVVGNALLKQGRPAEAATYYTRSIAHDPEYPKLHLNRGVALMAGGDTSQAIAEFKRELEIFPNRAEALNNLAVIAESRGELDFARQFYRRALTMPSGIDDARDNLLRLTLRSGDDHFQQGNLDSAEFIYREASIVSTTDPRPLYRLALIFAARGYNDEAHEKLIECLTLKPDYQLALNLLKELPPRK